MGDEVLMKKVLLISTAGAWMFLSAADMGKESVKVALIKDYQMMFKRIGEPRIGAAVKKIEAVRPPFVRLKPEEKEKVIVKKDGTKIAVKVKEKFDLQAIMNNRAKISGKWYKVGEKVDEFTLATVRSGSVFLQNNEFKKRLTLRKENENITIK